MRYGLIHYNAPGDTMEAFLDYAKDAGFDCVELQAYQIWNEEIESPEEQAEKVHKLLDARDMHVSAFSACNDFVVLDPAEVTAQMTRMKRICQLADILDTRIIRTEGGEEKESVPEERHAEAISECLKRCIEFIDPVGIKLAMDNHGFITNDASLQLEVLKRVNSSSVGLNLDTMNYRWAGHHIETVDRFYEMVAPYVLHAHIKDGRGSLDQYVGTVLGEGEIHLDHAVSCLKRAGYTGVWCVEYEGSDTTGEDYRTCLAWMKTHITA